MIFNECMVLVLLLIGVIFWSCEDNGSVANQSCCVDDCIDESKISDNAICTGKYHPVFVIMQSPIVFIATLKM